MLAHMSTPTPYSPSLTLDDFDDLMGEAAGAKPKSHLTSYGPVNPLAAPINIPAPLPLKVKAEVPTFQPLSVPMYYPSADPEPHHSALIHVTLALFTGGVGNIFYGAYIADKRRAWRRRNGI